ncbi:hypothetical protein TUMEXPCC7403_09295 [Tumidithrix helvetica PCC 7403]|uniref:hypothetical protein n=1 Tax=Tumidithrix helvetica TaxID=3457545 RepID=UPI003C94CD25
MFKSNFAIAVILSAIALMGLGLHGCNFTSSNSAPSSQSTASTPSLGDRYAFKQGGFSLQIPKGWQPKEIADLKYEAIVAPQAIDGFSNSINFIDEAFSGSLTDYESANFKLAEKAFKNFKTIARTEFKTDAGASGIQIATESEQLGNRLRQVFFIVDAPQGKKLIVTYTCLAKDGDRFAPLFVASLKSLQFN